MAIFNVPAVNILPGAERHSAAVDPPDTVTAALVQLTDPNGVWNTTVGNIIQWGVQQSSDNFASSSWLAGPNQEVFGARDRSGGMPALRISKTDVNGNPLPVALPGVQLRLAIRVDTAIVLGATVKTNADAA
jgi:hypothetical protein